ncbi:MAG: 4Fe-4S binding protein [Bacillota bacterium]|jgi:MinD superfamily P-loop ATPase
MQLVVLSGKGGTGKTTVAAAITRLAACPLAVDCDVDAANLHLLLGMRDLSSEDFSGSKVAELDDSRCVRCNRCGSVCRFDAIEYGMVDQLSCEGCGACVYACPYDALALVDQTIGQVFLTSTTWGHLSRAEMYPGADGSGKLVTRVREQAAEIADRASSPTILDGPPGIGCPVIATLTGCDAALLVLEPSYSSQHDFLRLLQLLHKFDIKTYACINRHDLSPDNCRELQQVCEQKGVPIVGLIPFDPLVMEAHRQLKSILDFEDSPAAEAIRQIWANLSKMIGVDQQ